MVGLIIALRVELDSLAAWKALFLFFGGILLIRAGSTLLFLPILRQIGIGITLQKATVLIWGGLRGAVALSLALIISQDQRIPTEFGEQILFMTAGIVVLTLLINGTTMPLVLGWLGLDKLPPGKQATVDQARLRIKRDMTDLLPSLKQNRFFQEADWDLIGRNIFPQKTSHQATPSPTAKASTEELNYEFKRRLLEAERKNYWSQFQLGILGGAATNILLDAVERALDEAPTISPRPTLYKLWEIPMFVRWLEKIPLIHNIVLSGSFDRLALNYDVARGFIHALNDYSELIDRLAPTAQLAASVRAEVLTNKRVTYERIEQLRQAFPEVIVALETRAASRSLLNRQRATIEELLDDGLLDRAEADKMLDDVEAGLKQLHLTPTRIEVPSPQEILSRANWLVEVTPETRDRLLASTDICIYAHGDTLYQMGETEGSLALIARGAVEQIGTTYGTDNESTEDVLGPGSVLGIYNILTGNNDKTIRAQGPVEIIWFHRSTVVALVHQDPLFLKSLNRLYDEKQCNYRVP